MATIKTGNWLKLKLLEENITQKELAERCGLSLNAISKIVRGERIGSADTWEKILDQFNGASQSVSSEGFIEELKEEVELYGESEKCYAYYKEVNGSIVFVDYALMEDLSNEKFKKDGLNELNYILITVGETLKLFELQNKIF